MQNYQSANLQSRGIIGRKTFGFAWCFAAMLLMFLAVTPLHAQYRASIQGTVTDTTGALIPGATLTLTDLGTNESQVRTSDDAGVFNFNALPADTFSLVVERKG